MKQSVGNKDSVAAAVVGAVAVAIVAVVEGIVVARGTGGASEKEAVAAVVVVAVLSNARPRRINTSRGRDEPAVLSSCAKSRWRPAPVVPAQVWTLTRSLKVASEPRPINSLSWVLMRVFKLHSRCRTESKENLSHFKRRK